MSDDLADRLVDIPQLRTLIDGLALGDSQRNEYLKARWLKYVAWWDARATEAKRKFSWLRIPVVVGSAAIPALVALDKASLLDGWQDGLGAATILVSLTVAICAGLESLFNYGDLWREKRHSAEVLKSEGFCFLQLTGSYKQCTSHAEAYRKFTGAVEAIIVGEIGSWAARVAGDDGGSPRPPVAGRSDQAGS